MIGQSKTGITSQIIFITLMWQVHSFAALVTSLGELTKYVGEKLFMSQTGICLFMFFIRF
jgi:hypothetical protein